MLITTTNTISNKNITELGLVQGSTVQTTHIGKDIGAAFKTLVGGEIKNYSELLSKSKSIAKERMIEEAQSLGADAIVGVRYFSASVMQSAIEIMMYGTAVKFVE